MAQLSHLQAADFNVMPPPPPPEVAEDASSIIFVYVCNHIIISMQVEQ